MKTIKIGVKYYGSVHETFRESPTYFISKDEAQKVGEKAGLFAIDVSNFNDGFEFFARSHDFIKKCLSPDEIEFYSIS